MAGERASCSFVCCLQMGIRFKLLNSDAGHAPELILQRRPNRAGCLLAYSTAEILDREQAGRVLIYRKIQRDGRIGAFSHYMISVRIILHCPRSVRHKRTI